MTGITLQQQTFGARSIPPRGKEFAVKQANKQAREMASLTKGMRTVNAGKTPTISAPKSSFTAKA